MKWPGQPEASADSKIPTIVAYQKGEAKYFGAEAREFLEDEDYEIARWFKLRLHPDSMKLDRATKSLETPPLPPGVSLVQVYSDFIRYIYRVAKRFFVNNTPSGQQMWNRLGNQIPIVFCTPNGWDIRQHAVLTDASIRAGIVTEGDADDRLWFLTEGEASVHYSLAHTQTISWLNKGTLFAVMDVGGSTVDSTLYRCRSRSPLILEEVCASACVQAGGIFIDRGIREVLERRLNGSEYSDPESISLMIHQFEQKTKRAFDGSQTVNVIQFGSTKDNDEEHGIIKGKLTLSCEEVEEAYLAVIFSIADSCNTLLANYMYLILVGGFGESPYLRGQLRRILGERGTEVVTVEEPSYVLFSLFKEMLTLLIRKKAAADGAVLWYLTELVEGRASRFDYGVLNGVIYDANVHVGYEDKCYIQQDGSKRIWTFEILIPKDTIFNDQWKRSLSSQILLFESAELSSQGTISIGLFSWRGNGPTPYILDPIQRAYCYRPASIAGLEEFALFKADKRIFLKSAKVSRSSKTGAPCWIVRYQLELSFKNLKLRAKMRWSEKGVERAGPASIIPITQL
ncbi:hypothetical protein FRC15_000510 [Serendipita sp. 397]|nr:hypothetical protein FRC15_000510 [Serendipita sp. 397]